VIHDPPDHAAPDKLVDQLHALEREFRCLDSDDHIRLDPFDGTPEVYWTVSLWVSGDEQRDALADELESLAQRLRRIR
jgi:hypothetical protein